MSRVRLVQAWGPSTGPTACALAGRRCALWGWRKNVPGGAAFRRSEGRLRSGAPPPPTARPLGGLLGSATHVLWVRVCGCRGPALSPWRACPMGAACRGGGGGPFPGGWPVTVVRGVSCQALSLPRPPVLWGRQPGFHDPCVPGAVGASVGTQHRPHSVRPCWLALLLVGSAERRPHGGAFHRCEGRLRSSASPPPTARPLGGLSGSATNVLWARVCRCGSPALSPWPACPVGAACRGGGGGPSPGGVACQRCEGCLVSGAVPSPAARPLGRADGVPQPVCLGCSRCGRGDPAPAPQRAPLRAGVACCGGGGRASPGGGAFRRREGRLRSGAPPLPATRPPSGLSGSTTHVLWAQVCGCCCPTLSPWRACPVGAACRGGGGGLSLGGGGPPPL